MLNKVYEKQLIGESFKGQHASDKNILSFQFQDEPNDEKEERSCPGKEHLDEAIFAKMRHAVQFKNHRLMKDILERYHGNLDCSIDEYGNSLLCLSAMRGDFTMLEILLTKGIEVNWQNKEGNTPLHYAIMKNFSKCIDTLINWQADENIINNIGLKPWEMH